MGRKSKRKNRTQASKPHKSKAKSHNKEQNKEQQKSNKNQKKQKKQKNHHVTKNSNSEQELKSGKVININPNTHSNVKARHSQFIKRGTKNESILDKSCDLNVKEHDKSDGAHSGVRYSSVLNTSLHISHSPSLGSIPSLNNNQSLTLSGNRSTPVIVNTQHKDGQSGQSGHLGGAHGSHLQTPRLKSILKTSPLHLNLSPGFGKAGSAGNMMNHNSNWQCSPRHAMTPLSIHTPKNFSLLTPDSPNFLSLSHGPAGSGPGNNDLNLNLNNLSDNELKRQKSDSSMDSNHSNYSNYSNYSNHSRQSPSQSSRSRSVSFDKVDIFEFELCAGRESDGVPSDGAFSLFLGKPVDSSTEENSNDNGNSDEIGKSKCVDVDEYERRRLSKLKQRAKRGLNLEKSGKDREKWDEILKNPDKYLYTAGRNDDFFGSLTMNERKELFNKRNNKNKNKNDSNIKKPNKQEIWQEKAELDKLRNSRENNEIYCHCKPLSKYNPWELKTLAKNYNILSLGDSKSKEEKDNDGEEHHRRKHGKNKGKKKHKIKKHVLIDKIKDYFFNVHNINRYSNKSRFVDLCCFDEKNCSCYRYGIDCHSGNGDNEQCGCIHNHKRCYNPNGCYNYKAPNYDKKIIKQWQDDYKYNENQCDQEQEISLTFEESQIVCT